MASRCQNSEEIGLNFIITGLEHSGTTLASELFRQVPGCDSGFECGVLLGETPREFPLNTEFYANMPDGWLISRDDLALACDNDSFAEFYDSLYRYSGLFGDAMPSIRFDKTPRYIVNLEKISRISQIPILVMMKDPRAIIWSDFQRSKCPIENIMEWYASWMPAKLQYMETAYRSYLYAWQNDQCLVVRLEDLCLNMHAILQLMFAHVGLTFSLDYLYIRQRRYPESRGNFISVSEAFSYRESLPQEIQSRVLGDFGHLDRWFYSC
jgi:hypothetical protein